MSRSLLGWSISTVGGVEIVSVVVEGLLELDEFCCAIAGENSGDPVTTIPVTKTTILRIFCNEMVILWMGDRLVRKQIILQLLVFELINCFVVSLICHACLPVM